MMTDYAYPHEARPEPESGVFTSFPDVPEALTGAENEASVPRMAQDALVAALSFSVDGGRALPLLSAGQPAAPVPVLVALQLALHEATLAQGVTNAALAKRAGTDEMTVRRMRDLFQKTNVDNLETALRLLGRWVESSVP
jgi:antitoxin HicB